MLEGFETSPELVGEAAWWLQETQDRIKLLTNSFRLPTVDAAGVLAPLHTIPQIGLALEEPIPLDGAPDFAAQLEARLGRMWATSTDQEKSVLSERLRALLPDTIMRLKALNAFN